ncbi:hypothetical protein D3C81_1160110 [compost metagenome]
MPHLNNRNLRRRFTECLFCPQDQLRIIHSWRIAIGVAYLSTAIHSRRHAAGELLNSLSHTLAGILTNRTNRAFDFYLIGNNVRQASAMYGTHTEHNRICRITLPADQRLQRSHHMRSGQDRVNALMRGCPMPGCPMDRDIYMVHTCHDGARPQTEVTSRQIRPQVQADNRIYPGRFQCPRFNHMPGTAQHFLCRLKNKLHRPRKLFAEAGQDPRCAEQHRHMPVVAASMHPSFMHGGEGESCLLLKREGVHVGAERDNRAWPVSFKQGHDARTGKPGLYS